MSKPNIINHRFKKQLLFAAMVMFTALPFTVKAQDGSSTDPFPIKTVQQLTSLAQRINAGGTFYFNPADSMYVTANATGRVAIANKGEGFFFKLVADIELNSGDVAASEGTGSYTQWVPIGNSNEHPFDGTFDGGHHLVSGVFISKPEANNMGLFGQTANHATIKNLGVIRSYVCGQNDVGGIVGKTLGTIIDSCFFVGTVISTNAHVGGVVGQISGETVVSHCYASATVSATVSQVGGIVGCTDNAGDACTITNCYSSSIVQGLQQYTGGILGEDKHEYTILSNLYYDRQMIHMLTAGIQHNNIGTGMETRDMIDGTWAPAGFTPSGSGLYPHITGFDVPVTSPSYLSVVPIILPTNTTLSDLETVTEITLGGGSTVSWEDVEIVGDASLSDHTFTLNGECYAELVATANNNSSITRTYPLHLVKTPLLGTAANPFPINNLTDLSAFRTGINSGSIFKYKHFDIPALGANTCFVQTADIVMPNSDWMSIGSGSAVPFKGTYDGGNHVITGWRRDASEYAFFRYTDHATIKNLTIRGIRSATQSALIRCMTAGTVDNCHTDGCTSIKGPLIYETSESTDTAYIRNSSNSNKIDISGDIGGLVRQLGTKYNVIDNCHNYGNVKGTIRVGGLVGRAKENSGAYLIMTRCSNHGLIENYSTGNEARVAGLVGHMDCSISYSYNAGEVKGYLHEAGIVAAGTVSVSYCYNVGNITCGAAGNVSAREGNVYGIASSASKSFNTGRITNYSTGNAYGVAAGTPTDCFNAGEVIAHVNGVAYSISGNTATRSYSIGRVSGSESKVNATFYDASRVPSFTSATATAKTTAQMTTGSLMSNANWVETSGLYPRIAGLDTLTISKAVALPITFGNTTDNVDHVSATFAVANRFGIKWRIEGTSGATISTGDGTSSQTVTLPTDRTGGNIILAAYKGDSVYYRITLKMAVAAPSGALTVDNLTDLQNLRDGINSGAAFTYKGAAVPAGGEGTTFRLTANFNMPTTSWTAIGTISNAFKGTFDGDNHTLNKLKQSGVNVAGLFGYVEGGTVKNLVLDSVNLTNFQYGGSVCGCLRGGTVKNCKTQGTMNGGGTEYHAHRHVGCVVGTATGTSYITNCENYINFTHAVSGSNNYNYSSVGGIVGCASENTNIDTCINAGNITGGEFVAGICANGGKLHCCINYGDITGVPLTRGVAGIAVQSLGGHGYITAVLPECYQCVNSGKVEVPVVSSTCYVSGVSSLGKVQQCYNAGIVIGSNAAYVSGVQATSGNTGGAVTQCFNVGQVTGTGTIRAVTNTTSSVTNCFYDQQMCTATDSHSGVTAKTTAEMCGTLLRASLGNDTYYYYEANMYPRMKGIQDKAASKAIAAPIFLNVQDSVTYVENHFTTGGCANHNVVWTTDGASISITGCADTLRVPGLPYMMATINDTIYKKVRLQVLMDAFIIKDSAELNHFRARINAGNVFYCNPADSTYHQYESAGYISVPASGVGATFRVSNDINLNNQAWTPIDNFRGTFDGGHHTISNFRPNERENTGFFGSTTNAFIKNLILEDVRVNTSKKNAAILVATMTSTNLSDITIKNSVINSSADNVGGIASVATGCNTTGLTLLNNTITGKQYTAGGVGQWTGNSLTHSYAKGCVITGTNYVGGFGGSVSQQGVSFSQTDVIVDTCTIIGATGVGGFFGSHGYNHGGSPKNIHVRGGSVKGTGNNVGGLYGTGNGLTFSADYCSNSASVEGKNNVGGIVGSKSHLALNYAVNTGSVKGNNYVGGLMGTDAGSSTGQAPAAYCVNTGSVTGNNYVGGIRGNAYHTSTEAAVQCVNTGDVTGNKYVGGIIGESKGGSCGNVNAGRITGNSYVGGLVGSQTNYTGYSRSFHHSYSSGQVYGTEYVGSVVGYHESTTVSKCYYDKQMSSRVKGSGVAEDDITDVAEGKLTREMLNTGISTQLANGSTVYFTYTANLYPRPTTVVNRDDAMVAAAPIVLADTVTAYTIPGIAGYTINPSTANSVEWSRTDGMAFYKDGTSFKAQRSGMTVLTASLNGFSKNVDFVVGVSSDLPCIIKNYAELTKFTTYINSGNSFYYNTADSSFHATPPSSSISIIPIAAGGESCFFKLNYDQSFQIDEWPGRIGTPAHPFLGDFNGGNHTISYLPNSTSDTCGFFGYNAGNVYNLNFTNTNMTTANTHDFVGVVAGYNAGKIDSCHVASGSVYGHNNVGAIAGANAGYVSSSYSSANVTGNSYVGGVVGNNTYSLTSCFNIGDVQGTTYTGGVAGDNSGTLTYSYNAGNIRGIGTVNRLGGVVGNSGNNLGYCYNVGVINGTGSNIGSVAGACSANNIATVAYDNQMSVITAFGSGDLLATSAYTADMTGTALRSVLGTDNWEYTTGLYPRLKGMDTLNAAYIGAAPVFLSDGERVIDVEHAFSVQTNNSVTWASSSDALDMSGQPAVTFVHCGQPMLTTSRGGEERNVPLQINYTASQEIRDTTCGEPYTWDLNGIVYHTSNTVMVNRVEADGCPYTYTLKITIPEPLQVAVSATSQQCYGENDGAALATPQGGLGHSYTYRWVDSDSVSYSSTASISHLAPNKRYIVTVQDALNTKVCTVKDSVDVDPAIELVASLDSVSGGCYGSVDGFFEVSFSGGAAYYVLSWNGNSRTIADPKDHYRIDGLNNGTYNITVTDAHGCEKSLTATLSEDNTHYTVTAFGDSKMYDGTPLVSNQYTLQIGTGTPDTITSGQSQTLANGDVLTATVSLVDPTDVGVYSNTITSCTVMRDGVDVTCQYNLTLNNSNVMITKRHVTLTSGDSTAFYPNTARKNEVTVSGDGFAAGETVTYNVTGEQIGGGVSDNTFTINWGTVNPDNYDTTKVYGTLTVVKNGMLIVRAKNLNRNYDGTTDVFTSEENVGYTVAAYYVRGVNDTVYGLGPEYSVEVVMNNGVNISMKDADTVPNVITSVHAYYNDGVTVHDVTSSFEGHQYTDGVLQINPRPIELISQGNTWVYDGQTHTLPDVTIVGSFVAGEMESVAATATGSIKDYGTVTNTIQLHPVAGGDYLASNYDITKTEGMLKITKRQLTITGVTNYIDYTGQEESITEFTYGNLVSGHAAGGLSYLAYGTEIGEHVGAFSGTLFVKDENNIDVTNNYEPDYQVGSLWIRSLDKELKVVSVTSEHTYDGTSIIDQQYNVTFGYVPVSSVDDNFHFRLSTGDTVVITPKDDAVTGRVHVGSFHNNFEIAIVPAAHSGNYHNIVLDTGIVSITPRPVTLRSMSMTKVYDAQPIAWDSVMVAGDGFVEGESATYNNFRGGNTYTNVGEYKNTFNYTLSSSTQAADYQISIDTGLLVITPATLTIKANDLTRYYGEPNNFTYEINGFQGEEGSSVISGLDANHPSYDCLGDQYAPIGTYTITPVLTGLTAGNYTLVPATGTLTVQRRNLVVNAPSITVAYNGLEHNQTTDPIDNSEITYTGLATGDVATASMSYARVEGGESAMNVLSCTITHNGENVTNNYNITANPNSKLIVTPANLTIKVDNETKTYDGTDLLADSYTIVSGAIQANDAIVASSVNYVGSQRNVGTSTAHINESDFRILHNGIDNVTTSSYNITFQTGDLTVTPKAVTVTADAKTKVYGESDPTLTATVAGTLGSDVVTYTLSRAAGEDVGTYTITPTGDATQGNYAVTYVTNTLTITKAELVVKVNNQTKTYGEADPDNSVTLVGLTNEDTESAILTALSLSYTRVSGEDVGTYTITAHGPSEIDNYTVSYQTGTLTITKAALTITADAKTKVYGQADPELTATFSGIKGTDTEASLTADLGLTISRAAGENVGTYTITPTGAATHQNYTVTYTINNFTITPAAITIKADDKTKVYDNNESTDPALTATVTGVPASGVAPVYTLSRAPGQAVDNYTIFVSAPATSNPNYTITTEAGTFSITKRDLTIAINDTKEYDGTALVTDYTEATATGLQNGATLNAGAVTTPSANANTYTDNTGDNITTQFATSDGIGNYNVSYNFTQKITQKALTITANSDSKVYDGTALTNSGYTNTALASTDHIESVTVTGSQTVVGTSNNVPSVAVIKNASDEDVTASYDITYANGTLEVTKKAITITADDKTKVYDNDASTDPALTATVTGVPTSGVAPVYTLSRTAGQTVGNYTITVTAEAASNPNYTITTETGTFSITPRDLTIKLDTTKVYDGTVFVSNYTATTDGYTVTGLQNSATITAGVVTSSAKDVATYIDSVATNYAEVTTAFATSDGISNYNVIYDLKQVITQRDLTIKLDTTKVYDGTVFVSNYTATTDGYTVTGLQNGATITAGVVTSSAKDVATYIDSVATHYAEVTTAFATSDGITNYNVIYDLKQVITQRDLTIKLDTSKVYDGLQFVSDYTATTDGYTVTGLQNSATVTAGVVTSPSANVGTYTDNTGANITTAFETNDDITNYNVSYDFTQVITPRPGVVVTIQEHGAEVEFNGTDQRVTGYSVSIADPINLYTVADFSFIGMVGDSIAHGTGSADALHIYDMNLRPAYFHNDNANYMDVTFQISDSALYIYPNLKAEATTTQVFCHTGNNGTATIEVTGGKQHFGKYYFSFEGSTPVEFESPHTYTDLQEGNYSVEVTDSLGYHVTVNFSITEVEQLVATIVTPTDLCPNQGSYPVRVNVTGGTTPYTYTWTGAQAVDADATQVMQVAVNDGEETYAVSVSVLDAHNCPAADDATFTVKPSVEKVGSVTYTCSNDTSVTLRYGVYDTLIILNQPTWTSNIPAMPLTLVPEGKPVTDRYAVPEGREDTTYIVKWHIVDTCGGDTLICTQRITVAFPDCAGTVNDANGNSYEVIRLGANCWTKPNYLAVPEPIRSTRASSNGTYKYNNDDALFNEYGYLYTWYAACHLPENNNSVEPTVVDGHIPGICPDGWALPTAEDYIIMVEAAGGLPHVKIADDSYWITGLGGTTPSSGFDAKGAGYYKSATDSFEGLMTVARFWTATPSGNSTDGVAVQCGICEGEEVLVLPKPDGCSVRCVKINN